MKSRTLTSSISPPRLLASLFVSVLAMGPASASIILPNGFEVFSSGEGLAVGVVDPRYTMTVNPAGGVNAMVVTAAFLTANNASSAWVSPLLPTQHAPNTPLSVYRIRTQIDLTGINVSNFALSGFWLSDNQGVDIIVNGNSTGQTNSGSHQNPIDATPANAFTLSTHLIAGVNDIDFAWGNGPSFGGSPVFIDPTSVRVEFRSAGPIVPEPSGLALLGLGMFAALAWRRRR